MCMRVAFNPMSIWANEQPINHWIIEYMKTLFDFAFALYLYLSLCVCFVLLSQNWFWQVHFGSVSHTKNRRNIHISYVYNCAGKGDTKRANSVLNAERRYVCLWVNALSTDFFFCVFICNNAFLLLFCLFVCCVCVMIVAATKKNLWIVNENCSEWFKIINLKTPSRDFFFYCLSGIHPTANDQTRKEEV